MKKNGRVNLFLTFSFLRLSCSTTIRTFFSPDSSEESDVSPSEEEDESSDEEEEKVSSDSFLAADWIDLFDKEDSFPDSVTESKDLVDDFDDTEPTRDPVCFACSFVDRADPAFDLIEDEPLDFADSGLDVLMTS